MNPSKSELVDYLSSTFLPEYWHAGRDYLFAQILSEVGKEVDDIPLIKVERLSNFEISTYKAPAAVITDNGRVRLELPRQDLRPFPGTQWLDHHHRLKFKVRIDKLPDIDVDVRLKFLITLTSTSVPSDPVKFDIDLDLPWYAKLGAPLLTLALEEIGSQLTNLLAGGNIADAFVVDSYRFSMSPVPATADPSLPLIRPPGAGDRRYDDPTAPGFIDILIVADRFASGDMPTFSTLFGKLQRHFCGAGPGALLVDRLQGGAGAYSDFASAFRLWQMPLVSNQPNLPNHRICAPADGTKRVIRESNYARLAFVALNARDFFGRDPVIVVASKNAGGARSMAHSRWVYFDADNSNPEGLLEHELGHTILGLGLGDEYVSADQRWFGPEPSAVNVSRWPTPSPILKPAWFAWHVAGEVAAPVEGAYDHDEDIFRPESDCGMKSNGQPYCKVCAERLTIGAFNQAHGAAGGGFLRLAVKHTKGLVGSGDDEKPNEEWVFPGERGSLEAFVWNQFPSGTGENTVELKILGGDLPSPVVADWTVRYTDALDPHGNHEVRFFPAAASITVEGVGWGTEVTAAARSQTPRVINSDALNDARTTVTFSFGTPIRIDQSHLRRPNIVLDPATPLKAKVVGQGKILVATPLVSAVPKIVGAPTSKKGHRYTGYRIPLGVRFHTSYRQSVVHQHDSHVVADGAAAEYRVQPIGAGRYNWSAQTAIDGFRSNRRSWGTGFYVSDPALPGGGPRKPSRPRVMRSLDPTRTPIAVSLFCWHGSFKKMRLSLDYRDADGTAATGSSLKFGWRPNDKWHYEPQMGFTVGGRGVVPIPQGLKLPIDVQAVAIDEDQKRSYRFNFRIERAMLVDDLEDAVWLDERVEAMAEELIKLGLLQPFDPSVGGVPPIPPPPIEVRGPELLIDELRDLEADVWQPGPIGRISRGQPPGIL